MRTILLVGLVCLLTSYVRAESGVVSHENASIEVKGTLLGSTLKDFVTRHKRELPNDYAPFVRFGETFKGQKAKPGTHNLRHFGMVLCMHKFPYERLGEAGEYTDTYAGVPVLITYGFFARNVAVWDVAAMYAVEERQFRQANQSLQAQRMRWYNEQELQAMEGILLGTVVVEGDSRDFGTIKQGLIAKFGDPIKGSSEGELKWSLGHHQITSVENNGGKKQFLVNFADMGVIHMTTKYDASDSPALDDM